MSPRDSGSIRYFKAQLRPLMKPTLWASAGLVGLSLLVLVQAFREPKAFWRQGDRDAVVNLDNNSTLTPEERAQAAELDDLSVLLQDLDERGTIESVTARPNDQLLEEGKAPAAIAESADFPPLEPPQSQPSGAAFESLPLLDLSPRAADGSAIINRTAASGFSGFDPRPGGSPGSTTALSGSSPMLGSPLSSSPLSPLGEALQRYGASSSPSPGGSSRGGTSQTRSAVPETPISPAPNAGLVNGGLPPSNFSQTPALPQIGNPTGAPWGPVQNSADNAYSQFLNPALTVPTVPLLPGASGTPNNSANGTNVFLPSGNSPNPAQTPRLPTALPTSPSPVFSSTPGAPVWQPLSPTPVPFSVPNAIPGRNSGGGQIRTFANP